MLTPGVPAPDFLATVAGIRPDSPGFETVLIEPKPGHLQKIEAVIPHPAGDIRVELDFIDGSLNGMVQLPENIIGRLIWNGVEMPLQSGVQGVVMN